MGAPSPSFPAVEDLETLPVSALRGVGPRLAARLERLQRHTVADLLFHLPLRYQDRTRITPMGALQPGDEAMVEGEVALSEVVRRGRTMLVARLGDGSGFVTLRFFHFGPAQQALVERGKRLRAFGEVRAAPAGLEMIHPELRRLDQPVPPDEHLTPVYPSTEGLHQNSLRKLLDQALERLDGTTLKDWLPEVLRRDFGLPPLEQVLRLIHRPPPDLDPAGLLAGTHPAQRRLAFEELVAHQLSLRRLRHRMQARQAVAMTEGEALRRPLLDSLPFDLTRAQERVLAEIDADLSRSRPMLRLVQGDVGSGKTIVAAIAVLRAVASGCQAAVMAPTELLAEQHYRNFSEWLVPLGIPVAWLTGRLKGRAREQALTALADGSAPVAVGTHALFQDSVAFARLGLVVIDEQHRFGVHQRLALRRKGGCPHQLVMTATPIPRTLAMTAYADLDCSVIDELPPGRSPVTTVVVPDSRRQELIQRVRQACGQGRQSYWVCPLIEESEVLQAQAASQTAEQLGQALPELRVGLVHGRLKPADKEAVMARFKAGELDLLVATTVIEVGVDVPNASLMVIENAERLGLAQLHQLRGRVGRGAVQSSCVLLYRGPLSRLAKARLQVLRDSNDGFEIARRDLDLRGPGEVLGTRQTGELGLKVADLLRDQDLLPRVRQAADRLLRDWPEHADRIIRRWIGQGGHYGEV